MNKLIFFIFEKKSQQIIILLSIFLFSFSLVLSRFVADFILTLTSIIFLLFLMQNREYSFLKERLYLWIFIFWLYLIISSLLSYVTIESLKTTIPYIRFLFFIIFLNILFGKKKYKFFFLTSLLLLYLILFIHTLLEVYQHSSVVHYRPKSFFSNPILGSFISKTYAIIIYLIYDLNLKKKYFLHFLVLIISGILVYLSSERVALFCFVGIALFSILYFNKKNILIFLTLLIFFFSTTIFIFPNPIQRIYYHTIDQVFENNNVNFFSFRHQLHFLTAYNIFKSNKLFGAGVKSFRFLCDENKYSVEGYIKEKIETTYAPFDGFYLVSEEDYYKIYLITKNLINKLNLNKISSNQEKIFVIEQYLKEETFNYLELYFAKTPHNHYFYNFGNKFGDYVQKGQPLFISYEFKNGCSTHPHNYYIQILSEIGVVGALFLIFFYFFCTKNLLKCIKDRFTSNLNNKLVLYANFFIILFPLLPSGNFFNNYLSILIYLPLAFLNLWSLKSRY